MASDVPGKLILNITEKQQASTANVIELELIHTFEGLQFIKDQTDSG